MIGYVFLRLVDAILGATRVGDEAKYSVFHMGKNMEAEKAN